MTGVLCCTGCIEKMRLGVYLVVQATLKQITPDIMPQKIHIHLQTLNTKLLSVIYRSGYIEDCFFYLDIETVNSGYVL